MTDQPTARTAPSRGTLIALAGIYVLAVVAYLLLVRRVPLPVIAPDEYTYGHLARSIADGEGLEWRGQGITLRAVLYLYAIAPAWLGASTTDAYALTKTEGTLLLCLTVVPTFLLARRALPAGLALLCAGLAVAGTWMTTAASILTENLALPLATAALAATVAAVAAPGGRRGWLALGFVVLAAWARMQCVALVAVIPLALVVAAVAAERPARERLRRDALLLCVTGGLTIAGLVVAAAAPSVLGQYGGVSEFRPSVSELLAAVGHQSVGLVAMAGFVPVLVVLAGSTRRAAWRSEPTAALLAVTWAAAAVFLVQGAWTITEFGTWHVQRYAEYVLPVLFVAAFALAAGGHLARRRVAAATTLTAALLLLAPPIRQVLEERAAWAISVRFHDLLGVSTPVALALATLLAGGAVLLVLQARRGPGSAAGVATVVGVATLAAFAVQDQAGWRWQTQLTRASRVGYPADLQWIDHAGSGDVARLVTLASSWRWPSTELFNRSITQVYGRDAVSAVAVRGPLCRWNPDGTGVIQFSGPCGAVPKRFYTDDDQVRVRLYDQRVEALTRVVGRVVSVPGRPRLQSLLFIPCGSPTPAVEYSGAGRIARAPGRCVAGLESQLWLDAPGTLVLRFRGDAVDHLVTVGSRQYTLAPDAVTTIRVPVAQGASQTQAQLDWQGPSPRLIGAELVQGTQRTNLL